VACSLTAGYKRSVDRRFLQNCLKQQVRLQGRDPGAVI
jgi:hypothetical protein